MTYIKEPLAAKRRRKSKECLRITKIPSRMTPGVVEKLRKSGQLDDVTKRIETGGHASKLHVVRLLDKITDTAPEFRRGKFDKEIVDMAAKGHSGAQIARAIKTGATWVYNRASLIGVKFVRTRCDSGHNTNGKRVTWGGRRWCAMCLEDAHPGALKRQALRKNAESYEIVRSATICWLGRQLDKAPTAWRRNEIRSEMDRWK